MSLTPAAMQKLAELGLSLADVIEVAHLNERPADSAAEKRRAYDRDRKRAKAESGNSGGNPVELAVVGSGGNSGGNPPESAALVRVEDNNLLPRELDNYTTLNASAWPLSIPPTRAELDALEALLRDEASPAVDPTATQICVLAPILSLARPGTGPPCDLNADVLPVIRAKAKSARKHSIRTWAFFVPAILEARDRRLQDLPNVEQLDARRPHPPASAKFAAKQANLARAFANS